MKDIFEVIAYNASGDMLWLRGADLDAEQTTYVEGIRNVRPFMEALKYAPRYNPRTGRFSRNRVALILIRFDGQHEEAWVRTDIGELIRVRPDGTVIERGRSVAPERPDESATRLGIRRTLSATRALRRRPRTCAAESERPAQVSACVDEPEQEAQEYVTCPKCNGKQGFDMYRHVPHKRIGGLCFECDGKGVISVADADAFLRRQQAATDARHAREQARADVRKAQEAAAHAYAWDRHGDTYRLAYALTRFHPHTHEQLAHWMLAGNAVNGLRDHRFEARALQRAAYELPAAVNAFGLDGLGLEEIEWLAAEGKALPVKEGGWREP